MSPSNLNPVPASANTNKIMIGGSIVFLLVLFFGYYFYANRSGKAPAIVDIKEQVKEFLANDGKCSQPRSVENFSITKIGPFEENGRGNFAFQGWPVYLNAEVKCDGGSIGITNHISDEHPTVYIKKGVLGYEVFIPEVFKIAQEEFSNELHKAFENAFDVQDETEISEESVEMGEAAEDAVEDAEVLALKKEFDHRINDLNDISFDELENSNERSVVSQKASESKKEVAIAEPGKYRMVGKAKGAPENLPEKLSGSIKIANSTFPLSDFMHYLDKEDGKIKLSFYLEKLHPEDKGGPAPPGAALSLTFNYRHAAFCRNDGLISWQGRLIIPKGGYSADFRKTFGDAGAGAIEISCAAQKSRSFRFLHRYTGSIKSAGKDLPISWSLEAQAPLS